MFKGFAWVSVVLTALVFVLAGLFFIIGLPGSDVCYAPGATLNNLVGGMDPTKTLSYYLTCAGSAANLPDVIKDIASAQGNLNLAQGNITAFTAAAKTLTDPPYNIVFVDDVNGVPFDTAKTNITTRLPNAVTSISLLLSDVVSCPSISGIFDTFYAGLVRFSLSSFPPHAPPYNSPPPSAFPFFAVRRLHHQLHHPRQRSHGGCGAAGTSAVAGRGNLLPPPRRRSPLGGAANGRGGLPAEDEHPRRKGPPAAREHQRWIRGVNDAAVRELLQLLKIRVFSSFSPRSLPN
jgi:hypothetical protein